MNYLVKYEVNGVEFTVTNENNRYQVRKNGVVVQEDTNFEVVREVIFSEIDDYRAPVEFKVVK
jgi:RNase P/RNase MRP subunit p29